MRNFFKRNTGRIGGKDGISAHSAFDAGIDLLLEAKCFRHRFDDDVGRTYAIALEIGNEAVECVADVGAFVRNLLEQFGRAFDRTGQRFGFHVG